MGKKKPYSLEIRELGRTPASVKKFATLKELSDAVKEQWQGADWIDSNIGFHTDYCTFQIVGATLKDLGKFEMTSDGVVEFIFHKDL